jgi:hypothetical protein
VTIAHEDSPDQFTLRPTLSTEAGARTMIVDPATHRLYLASARFEKTATAPDGSRVRPKMVANTFKVLVYGLQ